MIQFFDCVPLLAIGTAVLLATACRAQGDAQKPTLDPATTALLDKMASGRGATAATPATTITIEGTYAVSFGEPPQVVAKGPFHEIFTGTDLARHTSGMGDLGAMEKGVHREVAWEVDPAMGAKVHRGGNAASVRRHFAMLRGCDPRQLYREIRSEGTKEVEGRTVTVLRMQPAEGPPATWYVDADATLVRIDTALPAPESADAAWDMPELMPCEIVFADWRKVDGGRFPMQRTLRMGPAVVAFTVTDVKVGAPIDEAKFTPPAAVQKVKLEPIAPAFGPDGKPNYQIVERQAQPVASIRVKCKSKDIGPTLGILLPEVMAHLNSIGAKVAGAPFSRYHAWEGDEVDLEAGIPVQAKVAPKGRVGASELPAGKAVTVWHVGPYEGLGAAHEALQAHLTAKSLKARGGCWEIYWTDPGMVPDTAKWRTQLFAPIE
jgi:effector-binding domain-containing protein